MLSGLLKKLAANENTMGNALVAGILAITLLSIFGVVLAERMIIDAHAAAKRITSTKAFYAADAGVQVGRRWLCLNKGNKDSPPLGPYTIGQGSVTTYVEKARANYFLDNLKVFRITSVGTAGEATRGILELRWNKGELKKEFLLWREFVVDED